MSHRIDLLSGAALVWTDGNRARYDRRGQRCPSDLTNGERAVLEPLLPVARGQGRPRTRMLGEVMNGIRHVQRCGIPWDAMPKDLPPGSIRYGCWRVPTDGGHLDRISRLLVMADREQAGRDASPTLAIVDARPVKCDAPQGARGFDAGEKAMGRKRHMAVDTAKSPCDLRGDGRLARGQRHPCGRAGPGRRNRPGGAPRAAMPLDQSRCGGWRP